MEHFLPEIEIEALRRMIERARPGPWSMVMPRDRYGPWRVGPVVADHQDEAELVQTLYNLGRRLTAAPQGYVAPVPDGMYVSGH